ncbi:unnamed protein product [Sphenostylis stenocarpa]|uniref:Endoplasmic reticulum transmembrane protein n=1 Tax=Sphenostylis stenocarpa TaxID=92480 RepID=A0AA86T4C5_9FABA|nr:unnamed protein product [Sphenostylis stenocarpa]
MLVVFTSTVYTITEIQKRIKDAGIVNSTDEVVVAQRLLEASILGFSLFLGLVIDRQHYYIREINLLRRSFETARKQNLGTDSSKRRVAVEDEKPKVK